MAWSLKSFLATGQEEVKNRVAKYKGADFPDATMALAAVVAMADGELEDAEKTKVAGHIRRHELLQLFDPSDLQKKFLKYVDDIQFDDGTGVESAYKALRKIAGNPDMARDAFQIGVSIAKSDGEFEDTEKDALRKAASVLNLRASDFGL